MQRINQINSTTFYGDQGEPSRYCSLLESIVLYFNILRFKVYVQSFSALFVARFLGVALVCFNFNKIIWLPVLICQTVNSLTPNLHSYSCCYFVNSEKEASSLTKIWDTVEV